MLGTLSPVRNILKTTFRVGRILQFAFVKIAKIIERDDSDFARRARTTVARDDTGGAGGGRVRGEGEGGLVGA